MKKICLILISLLCATTAVHAANWKQMAIISGQSISLDADSITQVGHHRRAWVNITYQTTDTVPGTTFKYLSDRSLYFFDCGSRSMGKVTQVLYSGADGSGDSMTTFSTTTKNITYEPVTPDSVGDTMLRYVCTYQPGKRVTR